MSDQYLKNAGQFIQKRDVDSLDRIRKYFSFVVNAEMETPSRRQRSACSAVCGGAASRAGVGVFSPHSAFNQWRAPVDVCDLALGIRREWKVPKNNESSPDTYHPEPRNRSLRSF